MSTDAVNPIRHPISRWYLLPAVERVAVALAQSPVRPGHLTACGLLSAAAAVGVLLWYPQSMPLAAALTLSAWFFDRADGRLARLQNTATAWGAWLDANVDELVDLGLHVAVAAAAARQMESGWPWLLLIAFLFGKYLLMHGLVTEREGSRLAVVRSANKTGISPQAGAPDGIHSPQNAPRDELQVPPEASCGCAAQIAELPGPAGLVRKLYHLPGNTDVRVHLLIAAMLSGWLVAELALVAAYYNLRWIVRYLLVARRLRGAI